MKDNYFIVEYGILQKQKIKYNYGVLKHFIFIRLLHL